MWFTTRNPVFKQGEVWRWRELNPRPNSKIYNRLQAYPIF